MSVDSNTAAVVLGLMNLLQTALLVYQSIRLQQVHGAVNGSRDAAISAARQSGVVAGMLSERTAGGILEERRPPPSTQIE